MKKLFTLIIALSYFYSMQVSALHLIGGEISYECLPNGGIRVNMYIYRDCNSGGAGFDNPATIFLYNSNGNIEQELTVFNPTIEELEITTDGLCAENIPDVCVERGYYTTIANIPNGSTGYQLVYQRCCRNPGIVNLLNPDNTGSTYVLDIPPYSNNCNNSSPVFDNYPPIVICANNPLIFDHSATDADGDSLVYSICEPFNGADDFDPQPSTPYPYSDVSWNPPYSATNQLGGSPPMSIDPVTGELTAFPSQIGLFVVGICVSEYRDGVLLSTNKRDFQFNVTNCQIVLAQTALVTISGNDTICLGEAVTIQGEVFGANTFQWMPTVGLSDPNSLTPTITPLETLTYTLIASNSLSGCADTSTVTIVVDNGSLELPNNLLICLGDTVHLDPILDPNANLVWSPGNSLDDSTLVSPNAFPTETTIYTATITTVLGCTATDQMMIVVNPLDTTSIAGIVNICFDSNTQLSAIPNNALSYLWSNGATTSSIDVNVANTYTVTVTNTLGCISTASATVTVQDIVANLTGDTEICEGETTTLSLADSYSQYLWSNNATTTTLNTNGGTYSVTVTDANNCSTVTNITITENPNPTPSIIGELDIPEFTSTTWSVSPTFVQYIWSNGASTPNITVTEEETYSVTVTDANDCKGTAAAALDLVPLKVVLFPSAFSPNSDSVNDDFGATTKNVISYSVEIFNRWGQKVFSSDNISQRWDGTYKGVPQEMGVYVYKAKVIYTDNTEEAFKGNVSLVR